MPGKRPIDIGQHSADRGILKRNTTGVIHNLKEENLSGFANKENSLGQFGATTSAELAAIITDESGSGSLIFGTTPTINEPEINTQNQWNQMNIFLYFLMMLNYEKQLILIKC